MDTLSLKSLSDLNVIADKFLHLTRDKKIFAFLAQWELVKQLLLKLYVMS